MGKRGGRRRRQHGEGSVYQRADGRWVCELHLGFRPDGKPDRRYLYGVTSEEVVEKRRKFWSAQDDGFTPAKGRGATAAEWLSHWLHNIVKREVRESTWNRSYRPKVEGRVIPGLGRRVLLKDLDETRIEEFYTRLQEDDGLAPATVLQIHRILSRALKIAAKRQLIPRNPCSFITVSLGDKPEIVPPERHEATSVLDAVLGRWNGARWALALSVGPRQGEALGLVWPMLDLDNLDQASVQIMWELVRVPWQHGCDDPHACGAERHQYPCPDDCPKAQRKAGRRHTCKTPCPSNCGNRHPGKCPTFCDDDCTRHASTCQQRQGGGLMLTPPKSQKSRRTAALPRPVAELLLEHRTWQEAQRVANPAWTGWGHDSKTCDRRPRAREVVCPKCRKPTRKDALVFTQANGQPVDARRDWQEWSDLLAELGLPHYRPHDGRHFAATTALEEGVDVVVVQEMLGHATPAFTQATYQHVRPSLQRAAADKMGAALWGDR